MIFSIRAIIGINNLICYTNLGSLSYTVTPNPINGSVNAIITVRPAKGGGIVYSGNGLNNSAVVQNVDLWWPRGYGDPNLYVMEVCKIIFV